MNKENIPISLHHLIPLAEKWGIGDDGDRDTMVHDSNNNELVELTNSITDSDADALDKWFCSPEMLAKPTEEYLKFSNFFMAFEYAQSILKNRKL